MHPGAIIAVAAGVVEISIERQVQNQPGNVKGLGWSRNDCKCDADTVRYRTDRIIDTYRVSASMGRVHWIDGQLASRRADDSSIVRQIDSAFFPLISKRLRANRTHLKYCVERLI